MKQIIAVTGITLQSMTRRIWMSGAVVLSVALVVGVLLAFLAMGQGFQRTLANAGEEDVAIVLRSGSGSEINSVVTRDQLRLLDAAPGIISDASDTPVVSPELYVIVDGIKRSSQTEANITLRGVGEKALDVRSGIEIAEGRMLVPGTNELIVGQAVSREFSGFEIGSPVRLGTTEWTVVGKFELAGSVFESELWADVGTVQNLYQRGGSYQSIRAKLTDASMLESFKAYVDNEPRLQLDVQSEKEYFAEQGNALNSMVTLGWALGITMAIGAFAGAWNTMYSSVVSRTREIATLRAIGFSSFSVFVGSVVESVSLALMGGIIGALGAFLIFDGISASTLGGSFTQVVFEFEASPEAAINGIILALIVGLAGGALPAIRAARMPLTKAH